MNDLYIRHKEYCPKCHSVLNFIPDEISSEKYENEYECPNCEEFFLEGDIK